LLVSIPHAGTCMPPKIYKRLTSQARQMPDTDWFVDRLYQWVTDMGAGLLVAHYSRYVIDLNRPADNAALYTGSGTGLFSEQSFDGSPLYQPGMGPDAAEKEQRLLQFWQPYHEQLAGEIKRIRQRFGYAILLDVHSIRCEVPVLFEGRLPDLNFGTYLGNSADSDLICSGFAALSENSDWSSVLDGRFHGGYITRNYGQPHKGIHALQLEMAQSVYMRENPPIYDQGLAAKISPVLQGLVTALLQWSPV